MLATGREALGGDSAAPKSSSNKEERRARFDVPEEGKEDEDTEEEENDEGEENDDEEEEEEDMEEAKECDDVEQEGNGLLAMECVGSTLRMVSCRSCMSYTGATQCEQQT